MKACAHCGENYIPSHSKQKYCSTTCSGNSKAEYYRQLYRNRHGRGYFKCEHCGEKFYPTQSDRTTYCSRECAFAHRLENALISCRHCGQQAPQYLMYKKSDMCSQECYEQVYRIECPECKQTFIQENGKKFCSSECLYQSTLAYEYGITRTCLTCGDEFNLECSGGRPRLDYCSLKCYRQSEVYKRMMRRAREKRRAIKRQAFIEHVSLVDIIERDGERCHLCGKKVAIDQKVPHDLAPTMDHLIPLSHGGKHEYKNVALAHFMCNCIRGDREPAQLRLLP